MLGLTLTGKGWGRPANRQRAPGKQSVAGRARRLQNPFPAMGGRAIMIPVYGFFQSFPPRKLAGPSPTRTDCLGSSLALPALVPTRISAHPLPDAAPGVEHRSPDDRLVDAGHHSVDAGHQRADHYQHRQGGAGQEQRGNQVHEPIGQTRGAHRTLRPLLTLRLERASTLRPHPHVSAWLFNSSSDAAASTRSGKANMAKPEA